MFIDMITLHFASWIVFDVNFIEADYFELFTINT